MMTQLNAILFGFIWIIEFVKNRQLLLKYGTFNI
jgi:hypothetical protein